MKQENTSSANERCEKAREVLQHVLNLMSADAEVKAQVEEDHIKLEILSDGGGFIIGKKGQTLDALQYIVSRMMGRVFPGPERIVVDAEGYRGRRADQLRAMAHQVAQRVREELVPYAFDPSLSNAERRIVHMELKDEPDLSTQSEGEGDNRRLVVYPRSGA